MGSSLFSVKILSTLFLKVRKEITFFLTEQRRQIRVVQEGKFDTKVYLARNISGRNWNLTWCLLKAGWIYFLNCDLNAGSRLLYLKLLTLSFCRLNRFTNDVQFSMSFKLLLQTIRKKIIVFLCRQSSYYFTYNQTE